MKKNKRGPCGAPDALPLLTSLFAASADKGDGASAEGDHGGRLGHRADVVELEPAAADVVVVQVHLDDVGHASDVVLGERVARIEQDVHGDGRAVGAGAEQGDGHARGATEEDV